MTKIPVAETFYTLQGEGRTVGQPAVFLRTGGCNLLCGNPENENDAQEELEKSDDATWLCDTIEVWKNPETMTVEEIISKWRDEGWLDKLWDGNHLVVTGGEPTLHQEKLIDLFDEVPSFAKIEVETNGTIKPTDKFDSYVDYYNVSLKLSNSGMPEERRINNDSVHFFRSTDKAVFKFVISREEDLEEIWDIQSKFGIQSTDILFMPAGYTQEDLSDTYPSVAEICKEYGYRFSPRLHVELWNTATGV